jgi:hypothetical protein
VMWMRRWRRRVLSRRPYLTPPAAPPEDRLEEARQVAQEAEVILAQTLDRQPAVEARAEKAARIHQRNNLGPSFWRAMEGKRA